MAKRKTGKQRAVAHAEFLDALVMVLQGAGIPFNKSQKGHDVGHKLVRVYIWCQRYESSNYPADRQIWDAEQAKHILRQPYTRGNKDRFTEGEAMGLDQARGRPWAV